MKVFSTFAILGRLPLKQGIYVIKSPIRQKVGDFPFISDGDAR